ncbi:MAG: hypothetical protein A2Y57_01970 [Candidatus Woykebacteria bacterium RBG_13_40_7b]|uniref:Uncharacterized protein n=1 Tax=Candidatus Woykebacteria bacterium RBG_13_40_7b TaxID=1802594 RepID=A0A1G1WA78_9BACT|nr:MAG: hypothetical protein A2Y57_01970 [Candidatus Woykebacteria bacterium RBG_13_40_7b]
MLGSRYLNVEARESGGTKLVALSKIGHQNKIVVLLLAAIGLIGAIAGTVWDEVLLAGPIMFLVAGFQHLLGNIIGFGVAYVVFCPLWIGIGFFFFTAWIKIEPWLKRILGIKDKEQQTAKEFEHTWRARLVLYLAKIAKIFGVLATMVVLGPTLGWPAFKLLGYKEKDIYKLTIIAGWIFGAIWVPIYGLGVWGAGLSRVF